MPRKRELHERIKTRMEGKDPDTGEKPAAKEKKLGGTPEEIVAALSPAQREALYDVLVDYSYREFKSEEEESEDEDV